MTFRSLTLSTNIMSLFLILRLNDENNARIHLNRIPVSPLRIPLPSTFTLSSCERITKPLCPISYRLNRSTESPLALPTVRYWYKDGIQVLCSLTSFRQHNTYSGVTDKHHVKSKISMLHSSSLWGFPCRESSPEKKSSQA